MAEIEKKNILNGNLSTHFLESFKDLQRFFWKNLIFNQEENNEKDCQLKVQSFFKYKNAFMVSVDPLDVV